MLTQEERRVRLLELLGLTEGPLTGAQLSEALGVTRQVIVGDVAVLRACGEQIIATPRGYLLYRTHSSAMHRATVAVRHGPSSEDMAFELNLIVDLGGTVLDVTVEHPLYGELTANLQLACGDDVQQFITKMEALRAEPLSILTGGYHLHGIETPGASQMEAIKAALHREGLLAE